MSNYVPSPLSRHRIEIIIPFILGIIFSLLVALATRTTVIKNQHIPSVSAAGSAVLQLSPANGSFTVGQTFPIDVRLNSGGSRIVAASAYLRYDQTKLEALSIDAASSVFTYEVENTIDSAAGRILITRGEPTPGVNGSALHLARVNFRGLEPVSSSVVTIEFAGADASGDSGAIIDDGLGTDALNSVLNGSYTIAAASCTEQWSCADWSVCTNGTRTRTCSDQSQCGTTTTKPIEQQTCSLSVCTESWTCSAWSQCSGGSQTRTCSDLAQCGSQSNRPSTSQSCNGTTSGSTDTVEPNTRIIRAPLQSVPTHTIVIGWTGNDDQTVPANIEFSYRLDNGPWSSFQRISSQTFSGLFKGGHTIDVRSRDQAGNVDPSPARVSILIDPDSGISVSSGAGGGPQIRLFQPSGRVIRQFFAYESLFRGGVSVAVGDLGDDGVREIVTAPGRGREPEIRLYRMNGSRIDQFLAYAKSFRGGVNVEIGDVNGDGKKEIITSTQSGVPQVKIFTFRNNRWELLMPAFLVYASNMRSGVNFTAGDFDGDGKDELAVIPGPGTVSQIKIFGLRNSRMQLITPQITTFTSSFRGGANIASGDLNIDGKDEIVVSVGSAGGPQVRIFGINRTGRYSLMNPGFFAFDQSMRTGVDVSVVDIDGDGRSEIIASTVGRNTPLVRIFSADGKRRIREFRGFPGATSPGVRVGSW